MSILFLCTKKVISAWNSHKIFVHVIRCSGVIYGFTYYCTALKLWSRSRLLHTHRFVLDAFAWGKDSENHCIIEPSQTIHSCNTLEINVYLSQVRKHNYLNKDQNPLSLAFCTGAFSSLRSYQSVLVVFRSANNFRTLAHPSFTTAVCQKLLDAQGRRKWT